MAKGLTDTKIRNAEPREKKYKIYDSRGLFMIIAPSGGKWWRFKYRFEGKQKQISLGTYPKISLSEARSLQDNACQLAKSGVDPSVIRKAEKAEKKRERMEQARREKAGMRQLEGVTVPSIRSMMDGTIEIWKGTNVMRLSMDEARFVGNQLTALTEVCHAID